MKEIKLPTPFANVKIIVNTEDEWAADDLEKWIFNKCGYLTKTEIDQRLQNLRGVIKTIKTLKGDKK